MRAVPERGTLIAFLKELTIGDVIVVQQNKF
jgi:hypothetical protein